MKKITKNVLMCLMLGLMPYAPLFSMQNQELFNFYEHAATYDHDHQILSENPEKYHEADWWKKASPLFKRLWAAHRPSKEHPFFWRFFIAWYTNDIRNRIGNLNEKFKDPLYNLPFYRATTNDKDTLMYALIKLNISCNPVLYKGACNPLFIAKSTYKVKALIGQGAYINDYDFWESEYPLDSAVKNQLIPSQVVETYIKANAIINHQGSDRSNALHQLCLDDLVHFPDLCIEKAKLLIQAKININHKNTRGLTPLDLALKKQKQSYKIFERERKKLLTSNKGNKKLYHKTYNYYTELVQLLKDAGAKESIL